jgi:hypothetical protein
MILMDFTVHQIMLISGPLPPLKPMAQSSVIEPLALRAAKAYPFE